MEQGAEVFQVRVTSKKGISSKRKALQANVFQTNASVDSIEGNNRLHCHIACANYNGGCKTPTKCRNKRLSKEGCPITKYVGYHACSLNKMMSKKGYTIEQRSRKVDQQLQTIGPMKEEVRTVEYRDLWIREKTSWTTSRNEITPSTNKEDESALEEVNDIENSDRKDNKEEVHFIEIKTDNKESNTMENGSFNKGHQEDPEEYLSKKQQKKGESDKYPC